MKKLSRPMDTIVFQRKGDILDDTFPERGGERVSLPSVRGGTRKWILIKMHQSAFSAIARIERKSERTCIDGK